MDSCMICLDNCDYYLKLSYCECRNILHEQCFKEYINDIRKVKCLICKREIDFDTITSHPLINSIFYTLFFMIQNMYLYIDDKYFPQNFLGLRAISAVAFHVILILLLVTPCFIFVYINYVIMACKKPYKIYNL